MEIEEFAHVGKGNVVDRRDDCKGDHVYLDGICCPHSSTNVYYVLYFYMNYTKCIYLV